MKLAISPRIYFIKRLVILVTLGVLASTASATTLSEGFENIGGILSDGAGETNFDVGTANFSGGVSGVASIPELYKSGNHAWMVFGGETGTIQFGPETTEVSFYAKAFSEADGDSIITAFDIAGVELKKMTIPPSSPSDPFTKFTVTGLIDHIDYVNNDSNSDRMNSLDDFSVTAVPVPAAFWLFGTALLGIIRFSNKSISN